MISIFIVGLLFTLNGCSAKGKLFTGFKKPSRNRGIVYFYRPSSMKGYLVNYPIFNEDRTKVLGNLNNGSYFMVEMPENRHIVKSYTNSIEIDIKKNTITCVKCFVNMHFADGGNFYLPDIVLKRVSKKTCLEEIKNIRENK